MFRNKLKKYVGLLIKSHEIVAVEVTNKKGKPDVSNYSKVVIEEGIVGDGAAVVDSDKFKEAIQSLFKNAMNGVIKADEVFIALPEERTFSHQIIIPSDRSDDLDFIKERAKDFIPIELEKAAFDYKVIKKNEDKTLRIRFVATQSSIVNAIITSLKEVGIRVIKAGIDIDALIESFDSEINQNEGDFLLVNMDLKRDLLSINFKNGVSHKIISRRDKASTIQQVSTALNLTSHEALEEELVKMRSGESSGETQTKLAEVFASQLERLEQEIDNLLKVTSVEGDVKISKIYLTGPLSSIPTVKERLEKRFPDVQIEKQVAYTEVAFEAENHLLEAIGLGINQITGNQKKEFNLLPEAKKEELNTDLFIPKLKKYLLAAILILAIPVIQLGIQATGNFIDYQVKTQEVVILSEQSLNPYLRGVAKMKQERAQVQQQILAVLDQSVPVSIVLKSLDLYNREDIVLKSVNYRSDADSEISEIMITAEIKDRPSTEAFVEELESNELFEEVISPLSNLVGKGKRLVKIDLVVNNNKIIEVFESLNQPEENE